MSLKRRNVLAVVLLILSSLLWAAGRSLYPDPSLAEMIQNSWQTNYDLSGTWASEAGATMDTWDATIANEEMTIPPSEPATQEQIESWEKTYRSQKLAAFLLLTAGAGSGAAAIFVFRQTIPMLGPDGTLALLAVWVWLYSITQRQEFRSYWWMAYWADYVAFWPSYILPPLAFGLVRICPMLFAARELWGWVGCRCSRDWYAVSRLANHTSRPQSALMAYAAWIGGFTALGFGLPWGNGWSLALFLGTAAFGILGLGRYGCDLVHFRQQLDNFQQGKPIIPGSGSFASAESQLAEIRTQQEEAVRTAVTSERFKVELISNVSHDLRTPLTTILGYSELLQREPLSPEGQEQLRRLQEKAGYMSELVESLFELTKVSSGVVESKKEKIDLVRLLEQTIGLFDDQLTGAGLCVRRNYEADSIGVVTDGSRMHQVFANLLGNAIKYAMPGTRIYLDVKETDTTYLVRMMNTASYEMDFQADEIVQRFARGDKARSTQGSGLGLAIAQTYTQSVGGSFRVSIDGDQFSAIVELPKTERNL